MHKMIAEHLDDIRQLCTDHRVARLRFIGPTEVEEWSRSIPALEFGVTFEEGLDSAEYADHYLDLMVDLMQIFEPVMTLLGVDKRSETIGLISESDSSEELLYAA